MIRRLSLLVTVLLLAVLVTACGGSATTNPTTAADAEPAAAESESNEAETNEEEATESDAADADGAEVESESAAAESDTASADAEAGALRTFVIVTEDSQASYIVQEEFFADALSKLGIEAGNYEIRGTTPGVDGLLTLDLDAATLGENRFTVDLTGMQTDQDRRDNWIQENGPQFASFPTAEFVATDIQNAPESYTEGEEATFQLVGDLTVREITQPVTFDVTATLEGDTIRGVATTPLRMSDFGFEPPSFANTLSVEDEFRIEVEFTASEE